MRFPWLAVALAPFMMGASAAAGGRLEGEVVAAKGPLVLLRSRAGSEVVLVQRSTMLGGAGSVEELEAGDRVRVAWARTAGSAKVADSLEVEPAWALGDPALAMRPAEAVQRLLVPPGQQAALLALDVRPTARWEAAHLPGARSVPLDRFEPALQRLRPDRSSPLLLYSEGPRCPLAPEALRRALALGYTDVHVLSGGFSAWWDAGYPGVIEPAGLLGALAKGERFLLIDVRPAVKVAAGTISGAVPMALEAMDTAALAGARWIPPTVILGDDDVDATAFAFADRLRNWRDQGITAAEGPPLILAGGLAAWRAAGGKLGAPAGTVPSFVDVRAGEIYYGEFLELWNAKGQGKALLVDVRPTASVPFARHIPLERLATEAPSLPRDREVVLFCAVGKRSRIAYELLKKEGLRVRFLRGAPPS
jgi:rhodanese-related sulfurtransferase